MTKPVATTYLLVFPFGAATRSEERLLLACAYKRSFGGSSGPIWGCPGGVLGCPGGSGRGSKGHLGEGPGGLGAVLGGLGAVLGGSWGDLNITSASS